MAKTVGDVVDSEAAKNVQRLGFSLRLLERNHSELTLAIRYLTSHKIALEMAGTDDRWHRQEGMGEVVSLLHNYVSSAKSLVDHTRRIQGKSYQPKTLRDECDRQITERFVTDPLVQFVEDLREMTQHYRLPSVRLATLFQNKESRAEMTVRLQLIKADLEDYKRWSPHSKTFLGNAPDAIDVLEVAEGYHARILAFHAWFRAEQDKAHGVWPALRERLTMHGVVSPEREVMEEVRRRVAELVSRPKDALTYADLHSALVPALTIWDSRRLALCEHDAVCWLDHALASIKKRFELSQDVEARLKEFVTP